MCGRFAITLPPEAMSHLFQAQPGNDLPDVPNYNVCPTDSVHAVLAADGTRRLTAMRWGFLPHWYKTTSDGPLLINARAESVAEKPAFREAVRTRRCLIPASGFYEWTKDADGARLPWFIHPTQAQCFAFAGVWQEWERGDQALTTCAIVTTQAEGPMGDIHHRMPVIVAQDDWPLWLGEQGHGAARLMRAAPAGDVAMHRVDPRVNSNRASGPDLIEPISGAETAGSG
ncbi:SOS response-associated peptidase [Tranquillimonas rosea]|uniref:SOS response-associated peptidase n=1 Tax=Tranquillimonas rosea TaxID=641238 RepID=UPI003BA965F6